MGSGIYGLSRQYVNKNPPGMTQGSSEYTFKIDIPYVIVNEEECERYVSASKTIMRALQDLGKSEKTEPIQVVTDDNLREIAREFVAIMHDPSDVDHDWDFDLENVTNALSHFWYDYHTRTDVVEMPINYILKGEGKDGVITQPGVSCHSWHKGDVKFIPYPTYEVGDSIPVAFLLAREGVTKPVTDLERKNYRFCDQMWVKQPDRVKECRICKSTDHKALFCPQRKAFLDKKFCR
jgi:hypothetical protein